MAQTMKALQYVEYGKPPEVREVPRPEPGPGEVLVRITASGACHSDIFIMDVPPGPHNAFVLPLTLGHEPCGVVHEVGEGVTTVSPGEAVLVYGPQGCGRCYPCSQGAENNCRTMMDAPGIGHPGGMAEFYLAKNARHLIPIGDLDHVSSASLTDAGLTSYHTIKPLLPRLVPGTSCAVIGTGGLGHVAVQMLRALTSTRVIALDVTEEKLAFARQHGAHEALLSDSSAVAGIRELTDGRGADAVLDFVGIQPTLDLAAGALAVQGEIAIVGAADAAVQAGYLSMPHDSSVRVVHWGTRPELMECVELARSGAVQIATQTFSLDESPRVYKLMRENALTGRAIVVP